MSPALITLLCLLGLYVFGREVEHYGRNMSGRNLTPSRCDDFLPDEAADAVEFDSWAAIWESAWAPDELERLRALAEAFDRERP
jgi:hypothetical protein